jgi:hypothetical protein
VYTVFSVTYMALSAKCGTSKPLHTSHHKISTWLFISMFIELNSMTAVPYQCFVLSIVSNSVIHLLFFFLYLINLWFILSLNLNQPSLMCQDLFMNV